MVKFSGCFIELYVRMVALERGYLCGCSEQQTGELLSGENWELRPEAAMTALYWLTVWPWTSCAQRGPKAKILI